MEYNIEENDRQRAENVDQIDKDLQVLQKNLRDSEEKITQTIEETKSSLLENTSLSCQSVRDYCKENIIDVNNNLVDFKVNMNNITYQHHFINKESSTSIDQISMPSLSLYPHQKHQQQWHHQCEGRSARDKWKGEQEDFGLREKP